MEYMSVRMAAKMWKLSERSVRNYCAQGRVDGAFLAGKTWKIPVGAEKPARKYKAGEDKRELLQVLKDEMNAGMKGGIYHKTQIELTYNSNHIEGSTLTEEQTRLIFETSTIGVDGGTLNTDDLVETANHFLCVDIVIARAGHMLTERMIKDLHLTLKNGTSDSRKSWFRTGNYKALPNEVGGRATTAPEEVGEQMRLLLEKYNENRDKTFDDILEFHYRFQRIHPFQDGNGRVGRLIMFKECLRNGIVPFIIDSSHKGYYYQGLSRWEEERGFLIETCRSAQDRYRGYLEYFRISSGD